MSEYALSGNDPTDGIEVSLVFKRREQPFEGIYKGSRA
jgi:hypothetical protein